MDFTIREMKDRDTLIWVEMRAQLWPDEASQAHAEAIGRILRDEDIWGFITETSRAAPAGFAVGES